MSTPATNTRHQHPPDAPPPRWPLTTSDKEALAITARAGGGPLLLPGPGAAAASATQHEAAALAAGSCETRQQDAYAEWVARLPPDAAAGVERAAAHLAARTAAAAGGPLGGGGGGGGGVQLRQIGAPAAGLTAVALLSTGRV